MVARSQGNSICGYLLACANHAHEEGLTVSRDCAYYALIRVASKEVGLWLMPRAR